MPEPFEFSDHFHIANGGGLSDNGARKGGIMRLHLCSWPEVEAYLKHSDGIIIPIGSTEQHGPNGLVGTDAICPETVAFGVSDQIGAMVGPTFSIGMAQHHLGFAGSMTFRPSTLIAMIKDAVTSLSRHGFRHIYFLNGHGGNINTVQAAFAEIYSDYSLRGEPCPVVCKLTSWFATPRILQLSKELFGNSEGRHATPSEVSLTYYRYPEAIKNVEMTPKIAPLSSYTDSHNYRECFPDGRIGSDPSLATAEHGEKLFHESVKDVIEDYQFFLKQ